MNAQQILTMILRTVLRRLVNKGIDVGARRALGEGAEGKQAGQALRKARRAARQAGRF